MLIKKVFSPKTASCIHAALAHLCMSSKRHQEDKKWFDKFGERLALSFHEGKELLLNVESLAKLRSVFRGVKKLKDQQREKRKTPRKSKRNPKPPSLGVHLIWSRPDSYNALFWAFPKYQQRHLLSDCFRIFKELISERIGSASMMLAQHTDTIRPHEEMIGCKYDEVGKQLFGFKGISNTEKFATPKAVQLALRGLPFPDDCYDWQARMSYVLLAKAKERIRDIFWGLEPEERVRIIGEAMTYYHLLRTCTTDVTLDRRIEFQQELGDLGMDNTLPVRSQAYEEFHLLLGNDPIRSRAEPFPLSAPLEVVEGESLWDRVNAVCQRRKKAKVKKDYEQAILSHRAFRVFERSMDIDDSANEYDVVPKAPACEFLESSSDPQIVDAGVQVVNVDCEIGSCEATPEVPWAHEGLRHEDLREQDMLKDTKVSDAEPEARVEPTIDFSPISEFKDPEAKSGKGPEVG